MSYGNTLQNRLNLNFDIEKFGSGIDPFGDLDQRLARQSTIIRDNTATVYTAIANSVTSTATYFQNPVGSVVSSLTAVLSTLTNTVWDYNVDDGLGNITYPLQPLATEMSATLVLLTQELTANDTESNGTAKAFNSFISHTNRLSNLSQSNKFNRPCFNTALSVLQTVQTLVYQTETTSTTTVGALGLGAFTSLFIEPDLSNYWSSLANHLTNLNSSLASTPTVVTSTLTSIISSATADFVSLLDLLETRREHDENFYQNASSIGKDLGIILSNKNAASTTTVSSSYLIDNLIGTPALKNL